MPTRAEWQQLAEDRLLDAQVLIAAPDGRWSAAYYLSGYSVECGLKSCVLTHLAAHPETLYENKKLSQDAWTHDFETLLALADLKKVRDGDAAANSALYANWQEINEWSEESRYMQKTQAEAERLLEAINHPKNGIMPWIRLRW